LVVTYHVFHEDKQQATEMFFSEQAAMAYIKTFEDAHKYDFFEVEEELPF
tara:strand:- start:28 stop:177 length:150 start_codon:yes stop_codon:yes gene_type:complete